MRQNRASRFNRNMMVMMIFMAIVVLGCVYTFLYLSLPQEKSQNDVTNDVNESVLTDSVTLIVDSIAN